jgi:CheY-like chemotaxis protein
MPAGGTLTIELEPGPLLQGVRTIRLAVTDTGVGMDEATRAQAVEPFFTTKDESKGTGLGLAMVYGAVRQAGGDLAIRSKLGEGTTVEIFWPRSAEELPGKQTPVYGILRRRGSETILLVEDEPAVMRLVQEILEGAGYTVLPAHDGRRALQVAHEHEGPIDLLLTDVVMPGMGGAALAQQLTAEMPGLPVIYMSGYTRSDVVKERVAHHRADFLAKPVRAGALLEKVDHVLRRARALENERSPEQTQGTPRTRGG